MTLNTQELQERVDRYTRKTKSTNTHSIPCHIKARYGIGKNSNGDVIVKGKLYDKITKDAYDSTGYSVTINKVNVPFVAGKATFKTDDKIISIGLPGSLGVFIKGNLPNEEDLVLELKPSKPIKSKKRTRNNNL